MPSHQVFAYGVISSSTVYKLRGRFPGVEGYAEVDSVRHATGGEAANSSVVLARLGIPVLLDGNWLGDDDGGRRVKALLSGYAIDTTRLPLLEGHSSVEEAVFVAEGSRTIFGNYGRLLENQHWNEPRAGDISDAKVVSLDPFFKEPALRVADIASEAGIPVVTVDCRADDPLLGKVSAVAIAESYIRENYGECDVEDLFARYRAACPGLVIFTFGAAPIWYGKSGGPVKRFAPYSIDPVDTTGGGDAFRAGVVYGFLQGWSEDKTVDFAAATAALTCTRYPGVLNAPTLDDVTDFMGSAAL